MIRKVSFDERDWIQTKHVNENSAGRPPLREPLWSHPLWFRCCSPGNGTNVWMHGLPAARNVKQEWKKKKKSILWKNIKVSASFFFFLDESALESHRHLQILNHFLRNGRGGCWCFWHLIRDGDVASEIWWLFFFFFIRIEVSHELSYESFSSPRRLLCHPARHTRRLFYVFWSLRISHYWVLMVAKSTMFSLFLYPLMNI